MTEHETPRRIPWLTIAGVAVVLAGLVTAIAYVASDSDTQSATAPTTATTPARTVKDVASEYAPQMQLLLDNGCNRPADPQCTHWLTDMVQLGSELQIELKAIGGHDDIVAKVDDVYDSSERFAADRCFEPKDGAMPRATCSVIGVTLQTDFSTALTMLRTATTST